MNSDGNNRKLVQEIELLKRQMKENEANIYKRYEYESSQIKSGYEQNIISMKRENE